MTRDDAKVIAGYALGALAAAASLWAGVISGRAWPLAVLVWLAGGILGWILGIVASPQANEKRDFLKYAKTASAVAAGYLVSKAEVIFNKATETGTTVTSEFVGYVLLFFIALGLGVLFTYVGRRYV